MKSFLISKNDSGQRLDKFLTKAIPLLPPSMLYKYLRLKRIKLNHGRAKPEDKLVIGDLVECYVNDEFFIDDKKPAFMMAEPHVDIIYEDKNIALLNKPAGMLVHEDKSATKDTLINRFLKLLYTRGEYDPESENSFVPALCNRIDRNTCGIVIAAKNAEALRILNEKIKLREIEKKYILVVHHSPQKDSGTLKNFLLKDADTNTVTVYDKPVSGAKTAETRYKVLRKEKDMCLIEAVLLSGRTHQIRAQFAHIGCPLVGDTKYGKKDEGGLSWQALCSYKLTFKFKSPAGELSYLNNKSFAIKDAWFLEKTGFSMPKELLHN